MSERTNEKGFSLMELMVAMGILLAGVLAVASMLMTSSANSIFSNRSRNVNTTALELVEALKGEIAQTQWTDLPNLRLGKLAAGSSTQYEYQDASSSTSYTDTDPGQTKYVQRLGTGDGYIYKWRVGQITATSYKLLDRTLKMEVTVGWNDKKYSSAANHPCSGDPDTCARRSKLTNWIIGADVAK